MTTLPSQATAGLRAVAQALDPRELLPRRRPPADSLAFYALLAAVGIAEIVEWPAVLIAAAAQVLVDRRLDQTDERLEVLARRAVGVGPGTV